MTMIEPVVRKDQDRRLLTSVFQKMSDVIAGRPSERLTAEQPDVIVDEPDPPMERLDDTIDADEPHEHGSADTIEQRQNRSSQAWGGHRNGRIPAKEMKQIGQSSHRLEASAADAWIAMREAAAGDGITLSLTDSYRSYDAQVRVRREKGHLVATATPGTSVHGWGRAVDANVNDPKVKAWLHANGPRFGWVNPAWAKQGGKNYEPWHFEYMGGNG